MEAEFWHERWRQDRTAFHEGRTNVLLEQCFHRLGLKPGDRVFVPLCGKATDLDWLVARGHRVVGIELSPIAVEAVFDRMGVVPEIETISPLTAYRAGPIEIFVGDFFALSAEVLGAVAAVYDRAALVALPADMRTAYSKQLVAISQTAPQLLIAYAYDQSTMDGPPFSVDETEVRSLYGSRYRIERAAEVAMSLARGARGTETAWLLTPA